VDRTGACVVFSFIVGMFVNWLQDTCNELS
jgi:hypothetical protein